MKSTNTITMSKYETVIKSQATCNYLLHNTYTHIHIYILTHPYVHIYTSFIVTYFCNIIFVFSTITHNYYKIANVSPTGPLWLCMHLYFFNYK